MKWKPDGKYALVSDTGHRITKNSVEHDWRYAAIFDHRVISVHASSADAKAACVAHNEGKQA